MSVNCTIKRNSSGNVTQVLLPNGEESLVYGKIRRIPNLTGEQALNAYMKIADTDTNAGEVIVYKDPITNRTTNSYREALDYSSMDIHVGGEKIASIKPSFDARTPHGFANSYIKQGLMAEQTEVVDGISYLQPHGNGDAILRSTNSSIINQDLYANIGFNHKAMFTQNGILIVDSDVVTDIVQDGIKKRDGEEVKTKGTYKVPQDKSRIRKILSKEFLNFLNGRQGQTRQPLTRAELKERLEELLKDMGITQMSLSEYQKKYKLKTNISNDVQALADITRQVIAFKEGESTLENLTEEAVHFLIESMDSTTIENTFPEVVESEAYAKYSEIYRKKYSEVYKGDRLELAVKKEVLGKIVAENLLNNTVEATEATVALIERFRNAIQALIDKLFNPSSIQAKSRLNELAEDIDNLLVGEQALGDILLDRNISEPLIYYSLDTNNTPPIREARDLQKVSEGIVSSLTTALSQLQYGGDAFAASLDRLKTIHNELVDNSIGAVKDSSMLEVVTIASQISNHLDTAMTSRKEGEAMTPEQHAASQILIKELNPLVVGIREHYRDTNKSIYDVANKVSQDIDGIASRMDGQVEKAMDMLIEDIMNRHNLDDHYREYIRNWMKTAYKDTSFLQARFGSIANSREPLLAASGFLGDRIFNGSRGEFVHKARSLHERFEGLGLKPKDINKLYAGDGYIIDAVDRGAQDRALRKIMAQAYILASQNTTVERIDTHELQALMELISTEEVNSVLDKMSKRELDDLTREQQGIYDEINRRARNAISERPFDDSYYQERELKDKQARISQATMRRRNKYSQDRFLLNKDAYVVRGDQTFLDYSRLTLEARERLKEVSRERAGDKSLYTATGSLKPGIIEMANTPENIAEMEQRHREGDVHQYVPIGSSIYYLTMDNASTETSRIALDLNVLDQQFLEEIEKKEKVGQGGLTESFWQELSRQPDRDSKIAFIKNNLSINFSDVYWQSMESTGTSLMELAKANGVVKDTVLEVERLQRKRNSILSQFRDSSSPYEIMADKMFPETKEELDRIDTSMRISREIIRVELKDIGIEVEYSDNSISRREPNRAILNEFHASREKNLVDFLIGKLSNDGKARIAIFNRDLVYYESGQEMRVSKNNLAFIKQLEAEGMTTDQMTLQYSTRYLPSYYTRFVPQSTTNDIEAIFNESPNAEQALKNLMENEYVTIRPNYSYSEDSFQSNYRNPDFNPDDGGMFQAKKGMFQSSKYRQMFNPDSEGQATTNKNLFEALQLLKGTKMDINEMMGINTDIYKVPQVHQKGVDRVNQLFKNFGTDRFKQELEDFAMYRVDDVEYGQQVSSVNTIPNYYVRNIADTSEISGEIFTTYMMMMQQAVLSKHRKENLGKFMAINDQILRRGAVKGKEALSSQTYQMFKNYMDYALYGIKESVELRFSFMGTEYDFTKLARFMQSSLIFRNLAGTPIVPLTSMFTQEIQYRIDRAVGEIVQEDSARLASKEFGRLAGHAIRDIGEQRTTSELNIMMESLGVRRIEDRYSNSNYNKLLRNAPKASMALHQIFSFPTNERIALSILYDYRIVDGKIYNYNQFKRKQSMENPNISNREIKTLWKAQEQNAVRNFMEAKVDEGLVWTDDAVKAIKPPPHQTPEEYLETQFSTLQNAATSAVSRLDTLITESQRTQAQRHFGWSFLMTHMSWLVIGTSTRFKSAQRNLNSGQIEEGSYRTFINFMGDALGGIRENGLKTFVNEWNKPGRLLAEEMGYREEGDNKELEYDLVQLRQKNLKRVAVDTAIALGLMLIGGALKDLADDEDNEDLYALQLTNYIAMRTLHETLSNQTGIGQQWWNVITEPIVGLSNYKAMFNLPINLMFGNEEIESGFYEGYTKRMRELHRTIPFMKTFSDMSRLRDVSDQYYYHNSKNIKYSGIGLMYTNYFDNKED